MKPGERRFDGGSAARFFYCAKADREERNIGCESLAEQPLLWSAGTQTPGSFQRGGTNKQSQNNHPTVKPVDLMAYLCRLVTPPGGTVLDCFMGSGSTGIAALREGLNFIGIEVNPAYVEIARRRIEGDAPLFNTASEKVSE
jgi:site-specific DNA-methyltransferase (adenine-specific)